jgi:hypothetical protein
MWQTESHVALWVGKWSWYSHKGRTKTKKFGTYRDKNQLFHWSSWFFPEKNFRSFSGKFFDVFSEKVSISDKYNFGVFSEKKFSIFFRKKSSDILFEKKVPDFYQKKSFRCFFGKFFSIVFRKKVSISDKNNSGIFSVKRISEKNIPIFFGNFFS